MAWDARGAGEHTTLCRAGVGRPGRRPVGLLYSAQFGFAYHGHENDYDHHVKKRVQYRVYDSNQSVYVSECLVLLYGTYRYMSAGYQTYSISCHLVL